VILPLSQVCQNGGLTFGETKKKQGAKTGEYGMGDDSHVALGPNFPGKKGSVRLCVVVMQQPVPLSPNFGAKSSGIFTQSP
jgi:hypothetical protein